MENKNDWAKLSEDQKAEFHNELAKNIEDVILRAKALNGEPTIRSRELSVAITEFETAYMWFNKHRAENGYLPKNPTHLD